MSFYYPIDTIQRITTRWENRKPQQLDIDQLIQMLTTEHSQAPLLRSLYAEGAEKLHEWLVNVWRFKTFNRVHGHSSWNRFSEDLQKRFKHFEKQNWHLDPADLFREFKKEMLHKWRKHVQKDRMALWSPTKYKIGTQSRTSSNVDTLSAVVLDMDDGQTDIKHVIQYWRERQITCICHESFGSTPSHPKFRVVLPLSTPVPVDLWPALWARIAEDSPGNPDPACKDAARIYYKNYGTFQGPGLVKTSILSLLDWQSMNLTPPKKVHPKWQQISPPKRNPLYENEPDYTDPQVRLDLATRLGARISDTRAYNIRCPQCSRNSVWFFLNPGKKNSAGCNHQGQSCGWNGGLWRLAQ